MGGVCCGETEDEKMAAEARQFAERWGGKGDKYQEEERRQLEARAAANDQNPDGGGGGGDEEVLPVQLPAADAPRDRARERAERRARGAAAAAGITSGSSEQPAAGAPTAGGGATATSGSSSTAAAAAAKRPARLRRRSSFAMDSGTDDSADESLSVDSNRRDDAPPSNDAITAGGNWANVNYGGYDTASSHQSDQRSATTAASGTSAGAFARSALPHSSQDDVIMLTERAQELLAIMNEQLDKDCAEVVASSPRRAGGAFDDIAGGMYSGTNDQSFGAPGGDESLYDDGAGIHSSAMSPTQQHKPRKVFGKRDLNELQELKTTLDAFCPQAVREQQHLQNMQNMQNTAGGGAASSAIGGGGAVNNNNNDASSSDPSNNITNNNNDATAVTAPRKMSEDELNTFEHRRHQRWICKALWIDVSRTARFQNALVSAWQQHAREFADAFFPTDDARDKAKRFIGFFDQFIRELDTTPAELKEYLNKLGHMHYSYGITHHHMTLVNTLTIEALRGSLGLLLEEDVENAFRYCLQMFTDEMTEVAVSLRRATEQASMFTNRVFQVRITHWLDVIRRTLLRGCMTGSGTPGASGGSVVSSTTPGAMGAGAADGAALPASENAGSRRRHQQLQQHPASGGGSFSRFNEQQEQQQQQQQQQAAGYTKNEMHHTILKEFSTELPPRIVEICQRVLDEAIPAVSRSAEIVSNDARWAAAEGLARLLVTVPAEATASSDLEHIPKVTTLRTPDILLFFRKSADPSMTDEEFLAGVVMGLRELLNSELQQQSGGGGGAAASPGGNSDGAAAGSGDGDEAAAARRARVASLDRTVSTWYLTNQQRDLKKSMQIIVVQHGFVPMSGPLALLELRVEQFSTMLLEQPTACARAFEKLSLTVRKLLPRLECAEVAPSRRDSLTVASVHVTNLVALAVQIQVIMSQESPPAAVQHALRVVGPRLRGSGATFLSNNLRPRIGIHWAKPSEIALEKMSSASLFVYTGDAIALTGDITNVAAGGQILLSPTANEQLTSELRSRGELVRAMAITRAVVRHPRNHIERKFGFSIRVPFRRARAVEKLSEIVPDLLRDREFAEPVQSMSRSNVSDTRSATVTSTFQDSDPSPDSYGVTPQLSLSRK